MAGTRTRELRSSLQIATGLWAKTVGRFRSCRPDLLALTVAAATASLSCGSGHAILQVSAPSTVVAGSPFSATVTAMYNGQRDTVINGPIHFTTTDQAANLPTLYVFTAADAGSHTFTDLVLVTPGTQTVTVSDYDATPIAGTTTIVVTAASADQQRQPADPAFQAARSKRLTPKDPRGNPATGQAATVRCGS